MGGATEFDELVGPESGTVCDHDLHDLGELLALRAVHDVLLLASQAHLPKLRGMGVVRVSLACSLVPGHRTPIGPKAVHV